ncbi:unnamed protein product [Rotaria sp. Silwood1]|nr:unnamed protein product [Rotaria sp. Silwood1]CAF4794182.1 unnamed protein product [Rotaria sp. Silwood1]
MVINRLIYYIISFLLIQMIIYVDSKSYWNKLIDNIPSCLKTSTTINNDSFSVFIMIRDRFSYKDTLEGFINILYHNSNQLKHKPELVLFDFNSRIPVQIPSPYNNMSQYPNIKLIRFECVIPCIREHETCDLCPYPYLYFNYWVAFALSVCHLTYDRIIYFENDLYPNNLFNFYDYIGPESWTFRSHDKYYTYSFSTSLRTLIEFLYVLPDFLVEDPDSSLSADQVFIYYTNLTRCPEYLTHLEHEGGMKDMDPPKSRVRVQWRLYLYLQRYGNPGGGNIRRGGIGGNNQEYYCNDKRITCNVFFRKFTSFWGIYHIIDMVLQSDILWFFVFFSFNRPKTALDFVLNVPNGYFRYVQGGRRENSAERRM